MSTIGTYAGAEDEPWDFTSVGHQMRIERLARNVTVGDLADACRVTPAYLYQIETGNIIPSLRVIGLVCDHLKIHPRDLFR